MENNIGYSVPFEFLAVTSEKINNNQIYCEARVSLEWQNVLAVSEFYKFYLFPEHDTRPKTVITTAYGIYVAVYEYEKTVEAWHGYKKWKRKQPLFSIN